MKGKFATFVDNISLGFLVGLLFFCWVNFVSHNLVFSTFSFVCATALTIMVSILLSKKKNQKQQLTEEFFKNVENIYQKLEFTPQFEQTKWIASHLEKPDFVHTNFVETQSAIYYNEMLFDELKISDLNRIIRELKTFNPTLNKKVFVLCSGFKNETNKYAKSLNIEIELLNKMDVIKKLGLNSSSLKCETKVLKPQKNFETILLYALSPKRFKSYFFLGLVLVVSSFFVLYKIYYLIFGSILIFMSLLTLILKKKNART